MNSGILWRITGGETCDSPSCSVSSWLHPSSRATRIRRPGLQIPRESVGQAWEALRATGGLRAREFPPTAAQSALRSRILALWHRWDEDTVRRIAAPNLLLDVPSARRQADIDMVKADVGVCTDAGPLVPENWLRGQFTITCEKGTVGAYFTLAPPQPPTVQSLKFRKLSTSNDRLGDSARVACAP